VTVVEAPAIDRIAFEGNSTLKDKDLLPELTSKVHGGLIPATVQADVARLTEVYRRSGRFDVAIVPKTIAREQGRVDLVFEIREGGKTTVKRVDFVGNRAFAAARLRGVALRTPLIASPVLDALTQSRVFLKAEILQRTGSFKFRGAYNKLSSIPLSERTHGVVAYSSGNHAQGVAAAARLLGMPFVEHQARL